MENFQFYQPQYHCSSKIENLNRFLVLAELLGHREEYLEIWLEYNSSQIFRLAAAQFLVMTEPEMGHPDQGWWWDEKTNVEEWGNFPHIEELRRALTAADTAAGLPDPEWGWYKEKMRKTCVKILEAE